MKAVTAGAVRFFPVTCWQICFTRIVPYLKDNIIICVKYLDIWERKRIMSKGRWPIDERIVTASSFQSNTPTNIGLLTQSISFIHSAFVPLVPQLSLFSTSVIRLPRLNGSSLSSTGLSDFKFTHHTDNFQLVVVIQFVFNVIRHQWIERRITQAVTGPAPVNAERRPTSPRITIKTLNHNESDIKWDAGQRGKLTRKAKFGGSPPAIAKPPRSSPDEAYYGGLRRCGMCQCVLFVGQVCFVQAYFVCKGCSLPRGVVIMYSGIQNTVEPSLRSWWDHDELQKFKLEN